MSDKLTDIFKHQEEYMRKLVPTYLHNGFTKHKDWPWDLNGRDSQEEFRLLGWRFTEEVLEAGECYYTMSEPMRSEALKEELADALHFLIELAIVSGTRQPELLTGQP